MSEEQIENSLSPSYFKNLILTAEIKFSEKCKEWNQYSSSSQDLTEDVTGQIRTVIGQAHLLIQQRFKQFNGLIENYEFHLGEKETTLIDLQGFWDMIYFQVEDVYNKFDMLEKLKNNNWDVIDEPKFAKIPKRIKKISNKPSNSNSSMKSHILSAKQRLKEVKAKKDKENKVFEMPGFFVVSSPVKKRETAKHHKACTPLKERPLRNMVLSPDLDG